MPMRFGTTLLALFLVVGLVFIVQEVMLKYSLDLTCPWCFAPLHFLSGFALGGCAAWGYFRFETFFGKFPYFFQIVLAVLITGIGWEIFEYATGMFAGQKNIVADTVVDLAMDMTGAWCAAYLMRGIFTHRKTSPLV